MFVYDLVVGVYDVVVVFNFYLFRVLGYFFVVFFDYLVFDFIDFEELLVGGVEYEWGFIVLVVWVFVFYFFSFYKVVFFFEVFDYFRVGVFYIDVFLFVFGVFFGVVNWIVDW